MRRDCIAFVTPGLIPIEAFTTFGMNAKPNSTNPFGYFGTGLKIAIAVCLRLGQEVVVLRGKEKYTFYTKKEDFRGKAFQKVRMKKETFSFGDLLRKSYHDLPFTTELGKHWELWQAFREFQTNTMDESGYTQREIWDESDTHISANNSVILVLGQKFQDEFFDKDRNFLPDGLTERTTTNDIQVIDRPSKHVYYRGVRIWDLKEEAQFTYNFLRHVDLTEDRTAKYPFILESNICDLILQSEDEGFLEKAVKNPPSSSFERGLSYNYTSSVPSSHYRAAAVFSPNVRAKEIVKVMEAKQDLTVLRIAIPKTLGDEEVITLTEMLQDLYPNTTVESNAL